MAQVPFANETYRTPGSVDTGTISTPKMTNAGATIGQGLMQAGQMVGQIGDQIDRQNDQAAVNEAMTSFQDHIRNVQYGDPDDPESKGFFTLQGKSAMAGWQGALQDIDATRQQIKGTLTPAQQRIYDQQSSSLQNSAFNGMASHVAGQREVWVRQSNAARSDQLGDTAVANRSDPAAMQSAINGQMAIVDQQSAAEGLPLNDPIAVQRRAAVFGDTAKKMVRGYLADNDPIGAQHFVDANSRNLSDETKNDLSITLHHPVIEKTAQIWARQEFGSALQQLQPIARDANISDVLVSQEHAESGGRQFGKDGTVLRSMPGDADSPRGVMQIKPSAAKGAADYAGIPFDPARLDNDTAYNRGLGHAEMYRLCAKYGNNFTLACAAYNWGQGNVDKAIKAYGDPRTGAVSDADFLSHAPAETQKYVTKIQSGLQPQQPPPSSTAPDFEKATREAMAGPDWEENMAKLSEVSRVQSIWDAETKTARSNLTQTFSNLKEQRLHGNMSGQFPPEAAQLLTAPELQEKRAEFDAASDAGSQWKAVQWMPPAQQAAYLTQRETDLQNTDAPNYAIRREGMDLLTEQVHKANKDLNADPASYVQSHPAMQQVAADLQSAAQSDAPDQIAAAQKAYVQQSDAVQKSMGIQQPRVLTNDQAQGIVSHMTSLDLSKEDPRASLAALRQQYGDAYPQVMGDLVRAGLPDTYQVMDNMPEAGASVFADALKQGGGKSDAALKILKGAVDESVRQKIEPPQGISTLDARLAPLYATFKAQGAPALIDTVKQAALIQAYAYAGRNASDPVGAAAKDILAKYDISGAVRAPKGTIGAVMPALQYLQANPEQLEIAQPNSSNPALTEMDRRDREYRAIRSQGFWVTNNDETGYVLKVPSEYPGQTRSVRGKDGQPVTVLLRDIMAGNYVGKTGPYASDMQKRQAVRNAGALGGAQKQWQADQGAYDWGTN